MSRNSPHHLVHIGDTEVQATQSKGTLQLICAERVAAVCVDRLEPLRVVHSNGPSCQTRAMLVPVSSSATHVPQINNSNNCQNRICCAIADASIAVRHILALPAGFAADRMPCHPGAGDVRSMRYCQITGASCSKDYLLERVFVFQSEQALCDSCKMLRCALRLLDCALFPSTCKRWMEATGSQQTKAPAFQNQGFGINATSF